MSNSPVKYSAGPASISLYLLVLGELNRSAELRHPKSKFFRSLLELWHKTYIPNGRGSRCHSGIGGACGSASWGGDRDPSCVRAGGHACCRPAL